MSITVHAAPEVTATAISGILERMSDAWNSADSRAFGDLFAPDADFIEIRGGHHVGRAAIAGGHQALWDSIYRGSTAEYRVESVRPLGSDHFVAIIASTMRAPSGPLQGINHSRITAVVAAGEEGSPEIVSFHNTIIQPQRG